ncbi:helix-turn-helix domain-containing protein [Bifidobacterium pullorum subsp. saeculare]|uniref:Helix-turn-helix domain-containing protein n=1 Tax=Bifidobacterium pullorum subsp. saeculare TaxID=78257 RepID=A0A939B9K6_9BIFI|nr:helix-turn-helix domain-containing protein [Bifidobacterium pullorum]MBM6699335.1 helix-turn-helix domain-containing protein [Bifidobacterium pullorum subsp. saeculare]
MRRNPDPITSSAEFALDTRLTEELLDRLLSSDDVSSFLDTEHVADARLADYLHSLLESHGLTRAEVVRSSGLNPTVVYDIFSGKSRPGRDHAIALSLGLDCDLRETQRLLRLAGVSELWCKQRRDAIIIWCVDRGYDRTYVDQELARFGERALLPRG